MSCHNVYSRFNNIITKLHISFFTIVIVTYFNSTRIWACPGSTGRYTLHKTLIEIKTYTGLSIISSHIKVAKFYMYPTNALFERYE